MSRDSKAAREKPYSRRSFAVLDAESAKAKLMAMGDPKDANRQKVLSVRPNAGNGGTGFKWR